MRQTFSTFLALKIILIENANKIYLFFVVSELVLDVSDPMLTRTLFYHYQVGHCCEPTRTLVVAGSELVRVRVDPEPEHNSILNLLKAKLGLFFITDSNSQICPKLPVHQLS